VANNLTVESFDFDQIGRKAGRATQDALYGMWLALNEIAKTGRQGLTIATSRAVWGVQRLSPTLNLDNQKHEDVVWQRFEGATAINVTGFRAGLEGQLLIVLVLGVGTITLKHNVTSALPNRILTQSGGDLAVITNKAALLGYHNQRWREIKLA
jgi:hypothetical protein